MKEWMKQIPAEALNHYKGIGTSSHRRLSDRVALLVVDATLGFCGREGLSLEDAAKEFPTACGPSAWAAMPNVAALIHLFRECGHPVVYTYASGGDQRFAGSVGKNPPRPPPPHHGDFPSQITPHAADWVMGKTKASAFFASPLSAYLTRHKIDAVAICGGSTSGCVRATAVDAASYGYDTFVVEDCCFDRSYFAHCANMFDLEIRYADVLSLQEIKQQMG